jgi:phosphate transporter
MQSLVMGIAMASNIGGMTSPISSPQNIFAISLMTVDGMPPSWLNWFLVALPVSCVCNVLIWFLLLGIYRPGMAVANVRPLPTPRDRVTVSQVLPL